ncbi:MAG TPA: SEC-C domain-containing protein [Gemmatimonadaceae bacterium]
MNDLPGRNDPCHCGSGRKYKKCHEASDREAAGSPRLRLLASAPAVARDRVLNLPPPSALSRAWELDIVPLPSSFENDLAARPAVILVVAPPFVLGSEVVSRPGAEPDELAVLLARQVLAAVDSAGVTPTRVAIRYPALVEPLGRELLSHGILIVSEDELPGVADALRSMFAHMYGGIVPLHQLRSQPDMWAGWGMPADLTARLFRAAAAFHRAAPWRITANERPIIVTPSGGHTWAAVVLGAAGQVTGLALYHDIADLDLMFARDPAATPSTAFEGMHGTILSLLYNTRAELPRPMRAEIKNAGWEIAGPNAYPTLSVLNTPGGGIRRHDFEDLIAALESVPRFVEECAPVFAGALRDTAEVDWTDHDTGTTCSLALEAEQYEDFPPPLLLTPAGPEGPGATPLAALDEESAGRSVNRTLTRFRAWLRKPLRGKPPSDATVRRHADAARLLVELCAYTSRKPVTAISEFELRSFVYDWYPRKVAGSMVDARRLLVGLRKFFVFLEEHEGVLCPWAWPILGDVVTFEIRWESFPGGFFWDADVQAWQAPHVQDLTDRILIPVSDSQGGIEWGRTMGLVEFALNRDAHRLWIVSRDEAIRVGTTAPRDVLAQAMARQREWAHAPNASCGGLTPQAAIAREREEMRPAQDRS